MFRSQGERLFVRGRNRKRNSGSKNEWIAWFLIQNLLEGLSGCRNLVDVEVSKIILPDERDRKFYDAAIQVNHL
jgi:hypothetical protein